MSIKFRFYSLSFLFSMVLILFIPFPKGIFGQEKALGSQRTKPNSHSSVVCIYGTIADTDSTKIGNGFVVNDSGYIITTKHLVYRMKEPFKVRPMCGKPQFNFYNAKLVDTCEMHDCAVIKITKPTFDPRVCPPCSLADDSTLFFPGTDVEIRAYDCLASEDLDALITGNIMSMTQNNIRVHDGGFQTGYSGSPLFIRGSRVVIGCILTGGQIYKPKIKFDDKEFLVPEVSWTQQLPPYHAVPVNIIKDFLDKNKINFYEGHWQSQLDAPYRGNPHPNEKLRQEHLNQINLILNSTKSLLSEYSQYEDKNDADILLEIFWETSLFRQQLANSPSTLNTARLKSERYFIEGMLKKLANAKGIEAGIEDFSRAAYEDSTFPEPGYQIALYHLNCTGDTATVIEEIMRGLKSDGRNGQLLLALAMYHLEYGCPDSAKDYVIRAREHLYEDDPRVPFYMGLSTDPYSLIDKPMRTWITEFKEKQNRIPTVPEIQKQKEKLLQKNPKWEENIIQALEFFDESRRLAQGYTKPLRSAVLIRANEVLRGNSGHESELSELLSDMEKLRENHLKDPDFLNIMAFGYAALRVCNTAYQYSQMSRNNSETFIRLCHKRKLDLLDKNKYVERICELYE